MSECIYDNVPKGGQQVDEIGLSAVRQADEAEERVVVIYDSADNYVKQDSSLNGEKAGRQNPPYQPSDASEPREVKPASGQGTTPCRCVAVLLGLLCLLLAAALLGFGLIYTNKAQNSHATVVELRTFCKDGCSSFNIKSFYYISKDTKSWKESRQACKDKGADLVVINSKEEQEFFNALNKECWIGLSESDKKGIWKWVDGTVLNATTAFWHQGYPSGTSGENCVGTFWYSVLYSWHDDTCTQKRHWICEKVIDF